MTALLPYLLAGVCLGLPSLILAASLWGCWRAEQQSRKLPPL